MLFKSKPKNKIKSAVKAIARKDQPIADSAHLRNSCLGLEDGTKAIRRGTIVLCNRAQTSNR